MSRPRPVGASLGETAEGRFALLFRIVESPSGGAFSLVASKVHARYLGGGGVRDWPRALDGGGASRPRPREQTHRGVVARRNGTGSPVSTSTVSVTSGSRARRRTLLAQAVPPAACASYHGVPRWPIWRGSSGMRGRMWRRGGSVALPGGRVGPPWTLPAREAMVTRARRRPTSICGTTADSASGARLLCRATNDVTRAGLQASPPGRSVDTPASNGWGVRSNPHICKLGRPRNVDPLPVHLMTVWSNRPEVAVHRRRLNGCALAQRRHGSTAL
jgi:hypothetical protein